MILFESFFVALSTYSVIPTPQLDWNERNMKYAICFFPVVGLFCAGALWGWYLLALLLGVSGIFFAAVATAVPLAVTGGIHMDGFMDTVDALASHQPRERRLEIMKDSSSGAFAVIYCGIYLLLYCGVMYELFERRMITFICPVFVISRALSALCAVNIPNARKCGMLKFYTQSAEKRVVNIVLLVTLLLGAAIAVFLSPKVGAAMVTLAAVTALLYRKIALKQFGGVTGDTSGFFLQLCEAVSLFGALAAALF